MGSKTTSNKRIAQGKADSETLYRKSPLGAATPATLERFSSLRAFGRLLRLSQFLEVLFCDVIRRLFV